MPTLSKKSDKNGKNGEIFPKFLLICFQKAGAEMERKASLEEELDNLMDISIGINYLNYL